MITLRKAGIQTYPTKTSITGHSDVTTHSGRCDGRDSPSRHFGRGCQETEKVRGPGNRSIGQDIYRTGVLNDAEPGSVRTACPGGRGATELGERSERQRGWATSNATLSIICRSCLLVSLLGVTSCYRFYFSTSPTLGSLASP